MYILILSVSKILPYQSTQLGVRLFGRVSGTPGPWPGGSWFTGKKRFLYRHSNNAPLRFISESRRFDRERQGFFDSIWFSINISVSGE